MPWAASSAGRVSRLNWGLWRERGTVRTSTSRVTALAFSNALNSARDRVEWPTVNTRVPDSSVAIIRSGSRNRSATRSPRVSKARQQEMVIQHSRLRTQDLEEIPGVDRRCARDDREWCVRATEVAGEHSHGAFTHCLVWRARNASARP